jgi:hypothetical protein
MAMLVFILTEYLYIVERNISQGADPLTPLNAAE